jgi:hypothetical protein
MPLSTLEYIVHILYFMHMIFVNNTGIRKMTPGTDVAIRPRMGRKLRWPERVMAKLAAGTLARVAAVLEKGEDRTAFMREAIDREIERREKRAPGVPKRGRRS